MCDLLCDIIICVFEAEIWVKSTQVIKSCFKTREKRKHGNKNFFYINLHLKDRLDIEFTTF